MSRLTIHHRELVWSYTRQLRQGQVPQAMRPWLYDQGSLTRRLINACPGRFRVRVLDQGFMPAEQCEARALGIDPRQRALVREVHLLCDERPWVFARSIIPCTTLQGRNRRLRYLQDRPLGALLFAEPSMRRDAIEVTCVRPWHEVYHHATRGLPERPEWFWGRRSRFWLNQRPLLVSEFFLPELGHCR